jgi:serine/threonine protein kinase
MRLGWRTGGPFRRAFDAEARGRGRRRTGMRAGSELGRYRLLEPLGRGGMAEVWKARTHGPAGFEHDVVIKRIQPAHGSDPEFIQLFLEEARISGMLHHANIVQVHDFVDDGDLFLVLEYVEGPSLSRALRALRSAGRAMPPAIAAFIAREICRALEYVHALADGEGRPLEILHRDVTPSNILLTASGGIKLLDFGVAKYRGSASLTRAGTMRGKPAYLAPEQIEGAAGGVPIDRRVDIFALGVVLHEMLSLEHLFAGDSDLITVKKVLEMKIPLPSARRPDVPPELDAIVMKALERDRDRRYASAGAMARELDELVVSSRVHIDEVVAFVASIEGECRTWARSSRPAVAGRRWNDAIAEAVTVKDVAQQQRLAGLRRARGIAPSWHGRGAAIAGVALVAAALATAVGLRINVTTRNVAQAAEPSSAAITPPRCEPGPWEGAPTAMPAMVK